MLDPLQKQLLSVSIVCVMCAVLFCSQRIPGCLQENCPSA